MTEQRAEYAADYAAVKLSPHFNVGDNVRHPFYGSGRVIEVQRGNADTQYRIEFRRMTRWLYADNLTREATAKAA